MSTSNDGASSTITVSSPSPSIGSGSILGSVGTVVPDATTLLYIVLSGFPVTSGTCTTVYVAVITAFPAEIAGVTISPSSFSTAGLAALKYPTIKFPSVFFSNVVCSSSFIVNDSIVNPFSCSSTTMSSMSKLPVLAIVIVYSITSPTLTFTFPFSSFSTFSPFLVMLDAVFTTSKFPVSFLSSFVGVPATSPIFLIFPLILSISTTNSFDTVAVSVPLAPNCTVQLTDVIFSSNEISFPSTEINFVPVGILSDIYVEPSASPVFVTVIVYLILSPIFAVSTTSPFLVITLDLLFVIIAVFVGSPSLLSLPFAIAVFAIVPVVGTSTTFPVPSTTIFPFSSLSGIISFTFTVNLTITDFASSFSSCPGTDTTHFTPTTSSFLSLISVPFTIL